MINEEDILKLVEANKLMAEIIDRLTLSLLQHISTDEFSMLGILEDASIAAGIMKDYE